MVGNAGPVWQVRAKCQLQCQGIWDKVKEWAHKELHDRASVFRGKAAATNMVEDRQQMVRGALLDALDVAPRDAKAVGYRTNWPDQRKQWSITKTQ